ncbi:MAG: hypothetical protein ABJO02_07360 [Reichenbachiella sp.]|uniref:hypothetical protein n=1 Tax=Reichenbachiella sp. TaxID=2184521 RepID=UPI0032989030
MKNVSLLLIMTVFMWSCIEEEAKENVVAEFPETFTVDIPSTLSNSAGLSAGRLRNTSESVSGNTIYGALREFIYVGEEAAMVLQKIVTVVGVAHIANVETFTIESDEDGRSKTFTFSDGVSYGGVNYAHEMIVEDEDGSLALQVVWNSNPVKGTAILNPYYINRLEGEEFIDTFYRLDYEESSDNTQQTMTVTIDGFPNHEELDKLKMTVVKEGDIYEVFGNSNHPNLELVNADLAVDRNYAFIARADDANDIAVAEVALPLSTVETADVMDDYSIYAVFDAEIKSIGITDQNLIDAYLTNAVPPAYFDKTSGFLGAGENVPEGFSSEFTDLSGLSPYVPNDVATLSVAFLK